MEKGLFEIKKVLKCVLLAFVVTVILGGILAFFVYFWQMQESTVRIAVFAIMIISVLFSGFVLAKNLERNGLFNGLLMGLIYFGVILILSLVLYGKTSFGVANITRLITIAAAGMLGGIIGINT
ncbi:MAG: TIGR04086 family membrane protein [Clostridia bacterium]|nr:TIGR04086 family membrane protein [Clostridia bacterium]